MKQVGEALASLSRPEPWAVGRSSKPGVGMYWAVKPWLSQNEELSIPVTHGIFQVAT